LGKAELQAVLLRKKDTVTCFEGAFAQTFGAAYATSFPYGRSGLWAFLRALGIQGAEIILPAYTCSVVAHSVVLSNNIPKFVDVTLYDYNMDLDQVNEAINERTRVIIATHLFGYPLNIDRVAEIVADAEKSYGHKIWVVQDCAHSFGAKYSGKLVTSQPDVALFGLNISKILTSIFGGMLSTNNLEVASRLKDFRSKYFRRQRGKKSFSRLVYLFSLYPAFQKDIYGFVYWLQHRTSLLDRQTKSFHLDDLIGFPPDYLEEMCDFEARVGLVQLQKYQDIINRRRENAHYYMDILGRSNGAVLPPLVEGATYSHFPLRVSDKVGAMRALARQGVELGEVIQYSLPHLESYRPYVEDEGRYPNSLLCSRSIINLPVHPGLRWAEKERAAAAMNCYLTNKTRRVARSSEQNCYDKHWKNHGQRDVPDSKLREAMVFFNPVLDQLKSEALKVLDVGCGNGVHWRFLRGIGNRNLSYTGVDISQAAIEYLRCLSNEETDKFMLMDATELGGPDGSYDLVFSFGVLGYTSDPRIAFAEMCRVCRPGGWLGIWIYPKREGLTGWAFQSVRGLCRRLGYFWTRRIADLLVPILGFLPTRSKMSLRNSSWRECREIVMVNIAPERLAFFSSDEIRQWFSEESIDNKFEDPENPITMWGSKRV
jgi:dTDP-4-amino-4,6-dideoxygalactose transaminase/ubiquinone/menaquinone biosynthesis C-methylase UbiE